MIALYTGVGLCKIYIKFFVDHILSEEPMSQLFPGIISNSRKLPIFLAVLGNMSISRLFANLAFDLCKQDVGITFPVS